MLDEYPRPQLVRESYLCLNGIWEYQISKSKDIPEDFTDTLIVPYSLECKINEEKHLLKPDEYLFYRRQLYIPEDFVKDKILLHFTAVDQFADIYINNHLVYSHEGGFLPFVVDITSYLEEVNTLIVRVRDLSDTSYLSRGKQKLNHGKIWYTPQSGIYLPVWMESVNNEYVEDIHYLPDIDNSLIKIKITSLSPQCKITIDEKEYVIVTNEYVSIPLDNIHLWSPEDPYLYPVKIRCGQEEVTSYFAMRKFSKIKVGNKWYFGLNNQVYFLKGVLDQGYYLKGLLTPEKDEDYINDISLMKSLGFNALRKHIKIEPLRYYYHADRLGMIIIQDFVNGGSKYHFPIIAFPLISDIHIKDNKYSLFSRKNKVGREKALQEYIETLNYLKNVPCIGIWTIFNEGWGQFDSESIYSKLIKIDNTRLYDHASGWHDQGISDFKSLHVYFKKFKMPKENKIKDRIVILSECGGYNLPVANHMATEVSYGYKSMKDKTQLMERYMRFIKEEITPNVKKGLAGFIYTQLSDVEEECNGFISFDREVVKVDIPFIKSINDSIK